MGEDTHRIEIGGVVRELPLVKIADGQLTIAVLNILGDTELVEAAAEALVSALERTSFDYIVTPEAKSIPVAHAVSVRLGCRPYVVLRKSYKTYMGRAISATSESITTKGEQTLHLDEKDAKFLAGKKVAVLDDVISTGSTLQAAHRLVEQAGATVACDVAIMTEGDAAKWEHVISLGHLPVWN